MKAKKDVVASIKELPMMKVDKDYLFKDEHNKTVRFEDLFNGKDQLIVYHFMFGPNKDKGCPYCSSFVDTFPDFRELRDKNTSLVCVSRAPAEKLLPYKQVKGWTWPWYSTDGSSFNYDFHATHDESVLPIQHSFQSKGEIEASGEKAPSGDVGGISVFYKQNGQVFYTYADFEDDGAPMSTFTLLNMTPLGNQ